MTPRCNCRVRRNGHRYVQGSLTGAWYAMRYSEDGVDNHPIAHSGFLTLEDAIRHAEKTR